MNKIIIIFSLIFTLSCKKTSNNQSNPSSPIFGKWHLDSAIYTYNDTQTYFRTKSISFSYFKDSNDLRCNSGSYLIINDDPKEIWKENKYYVEFNSNNSGNTIRDCDYFIFDSLKSVQNCRVLYDSTVQMKTESINYSFTDSSITFPFYGGFWSPMNSETWKIESKSSNTLLLNSIIFFGANKINRKIYLKK